MRVAAWTTGEASTISSTSTPASGQPVTLRVTSPHVPCVVIPLRHSVWKTSGRSSSVTQWSWMFWRTVTSAIPRVALGEPGDRAKLVSLELTVRDPDADHEVARRLALTTLAADRADTVTLRVDAPPAEVGPEPLRG